MAGWAWTFAEMGTAEHLMLKVAPDRTIERIPVAWHEVLEPSDDMLPTGVTV